MNDEVVRAHVHIYGQVQGVGYRYATQTQARLLGIRGWVRNVADGSVEAEFEGTREQVEEMLAWCQHGPPGAVVRRVATTWESGDRKYEKFAIVR